MLFIHVKLGIELKKSVSSVQISDPLTVKSAYKEPAYKDSGYKKLIFIPQSLPRN